MNKKTYSFLQQKMGSLERDLFDASKDREINMAHYVSHFLPYLSIGLRYLFYGALEVVVKFLVFLTKTPTDAYKIMVAPIEKLELEEHELKGHRDYKEFVEVHKKEKLSSMRFVGASVLAVAVLSFVISVVVPYGDRALGASYTWTQKSPALLGGGWVTAPPTNSTECTNAGGTWTTGGECAMTHPDTGVWSTYTSADPGILVGDTIKLEATTQTHTDTSVGGDFIPGYCEDGCTNVVPANNSRIRPSGEIVIESVFMCGESILVDISGNTYETIEIPTVPPQCWTKRNMNTGVFTTGGQTDNGIIEKWCYGHDPNNCAIEGGFYIFAELMAHDKSALNNQPAEGGQGICPVGWHVPSEADWSILESFYWNESGSCDSPREASACGPASTELRIGGSSGFDWLNNTGYFSLVSWSNQNSGYLWTSTRKDWVTGGFWPYGRSVSGGGGVTSAIHHPGQVRMPTRCLKNL